MLDFTTDFGKRAAERLARDTVAWLTTLDEDGMPQPSPVWFLWDGETVLIYSKPNAPKVRNIERHGRVAFNFNSDAHGEDIVILTGEAVIDRDAPLATGVAAYLTKHEQGIASIGMTPEAMAADFSTAIRITPMKLRGH